MSEPTIDTDDTWVTLIFQHKIEKVRGEVQAVLQAFTGIMARQELQNSPGLRVKKISENAILSLLLMPVRLK